MSLVICLFCVATLLPHIGLADAEPLNQLKLLPSARFADLLVLQIFEQYDANGKDETEKKLKEVLQLKKLHPLARSRAQYLMARLKSMTGDAENANREVASMGFITDWTFAGPFPNDSGSGMDEPFLIDNPNPPLLPTAPECLPSLSRGPCSFQSSWMSTSLGRIDFAPVFADSENICVLAQTDILVDVAGNHQFIFGAGGQSSVYVNNRQIHKNLDWYHADINRHQLHIPLQKGENKLTVKICSNESGIAEFYARVIAPDGTVPKSTSGAFLPLMNTESRSVQRRTLLEELTPTGNTRPSHRGYFAQYALSTGAIGNTTLATDAARAACEQLKTVSMCATWAALAEDVNTRRQAWLTVLGATPNSIKAQDALLSLRATHLLDGDVPYDLERRMSGKMTSTEIRCAHLKYLTSSLPLQAKKIRSQRIKVPNIPPGELKCLADSLEGLPADAITRKIMKRAIEVDQTNYTNQLRLIQSESANNGDLLTTTLKKWQQIGTPSKAQLITMMRLMHGAGRNTAFNSLSAALLRNAPGVGEYREEIGLFHLYANNIPPAIRFLRQALSLTPQDKSLREFLVHLEPEESFETPYVIPPSDFLAGRQKCIDRKEDCMLVNNTMTRVHKNGLSSTVTQVVVAIATRNGAREWQQYSEQFSSNQTTRVLEARLFRSDGKIAHATGQMTFPVSEPWYRLYYDIEAQVVELPKPQVGDVVAFRFRTDDIAKENLFGDYFGTIVPVNADMPVERFQFVLIRPGSFKVMFETSKKIARTDKVEGNITTTVFEDSALPPIPDEPATPGSMSLVDYIHATTWQSFKNMEKWYEQLIQPQLKSDSTLKTQVRRLTRHAKSLREKIAAIYNWVTRNIRYVGLEFGIHGYKPYSTTQIMARGFGDCKDTASLIVTMLREAGINAHVALVRTRSAGELRTQRPSLALFNHAIAFVPEFNLWLDGTATFHGVGDMPFEDQGVDALVIGMYNDELLQTSTKGSDAAAFNQNDVITLSRDGSGEIVSRISGAGAPFAPWLRRTFAPSQRREILEDHFSEMYSGIKIEDANFNRLAQLESTPEIRFKGMIPSLFSVRGDHASFPATPTLNLKRKFASTKHRSHPLSLGPPRTATYSVKYILPSNTKGIADEGVQTHESTFATYTRELKRTADGISITRIFEIKKPLVNPGEYSEFLEFVTKVDATERGHIEIQLNGGATQ